MSDATSSQNTLEVRGLSARYGQVEVLRNVSFEVPRGSVVVVLGANGAGKTTTLRAICNMVSCNGEVVLEGDSISGVDTAQIVGRGVAHIPQGRGTFPELSVIDNLEVGAYVRNDREVRSDIDMWFEKFPRLRERKDQLAGSLSGGEQQMLAVARALMSRPKLVLLDEPSLGLAPLIIEDLFQTFKQLNEESGVTMLVVEQNANLALEIAQQGYVLEAGEIVLSGSAQVLRDDPAVQEAYLGA
ncbi:MAG: ABC transporter ATP-binding protein [Acidimicrobiales bacterium]